MKRVLWAILMIAVSTNLPAPLFPVYQMQYQLNHLQITALFAVYAACLLPILLLSGSLAERFGLRRIVMTGVACALLSALCFLFAVTPAMLYLARVLEGLAVGTFMGTGNAFLISQSKSDVPKALSYASMFNMFGFGFGPLLCGLIAQYSPFFPQKLSYFLLILGLIAAICMLFTCDRKKNAEHKTEHKERKLRITLGVPKEEKRIFWTFIAPAAFIMLALNGVVISLVPTYVKELFQTNNLSYSGILLFLMLFGSGLVQLIPRPHDNERRVKVGIVFLILGTWTMIAASPLHSILILTIGMILQAMGTGYTFQGALRMTGDISSPQNRSHILSTFYVCAYSGMAFPTIGIGLLSTLWGLDQALFVFGILLSVIGILVLLLRFLHSSFFFSLFWKE